MFTIEVAFDDVPLVADGEAHTGYCDGYAEVTFSWSGKFAIGAITLEGLERVRNGEFGSSVVRRRIPCPHMLQAIIRKHLTEDEGWRQTIQDHVDTYRRQAAVA